LPQQWKESIIVPIYKSVIKLTSYYKGISLLPTTYIFYSIFLSQG
jgi:accessory gene regulator protein AgrB